MKDKVIPSWDHLFWWGMIKLETSFNKYVQVVFRKQAFCGISLVKTVIE